MLLWSYRHALCEVEETLGSVIVETLIDCGCRDAACGVTEMLVVELQ